jgi:tryptophan halogenase
MRQNPAQKIYKHIGIIGGGTAGYFTALAIKKNHPDLKVTLIESDKIPVIGVGESTTCAIVNFLHKELGFSIQEFYKEVEPTWKLGIKFEWGQSETGFFNYPFSLHDTYGGKYLANDINSGSLASLLMCEEKSFFFMNRGQPRMFHEIASQTNYAYHLDNIKLIAFLKKKAAEASIQLINTTLTNMVVNEETGLLKEVKDNSGRSFSFDLYVDCTGFRSSLLGGIMKSKFISYADSLFTDQALVGSVANEEFIKPYTTASTMNHGWMWNIPLREEDHIGYVFSSSFCSKEEAYDEYKRKHPEASEPKLIKFTTGRREACWLGNVMGVGNSYAFVEPLESTGIHMIISTVKSLVGALSQKDMIAARSEVNRALGARWDHLRWFLAWHYKFNKKLETPFWKATRNESNASGYQELYKIFKEKGPFRKPENFNDKALNHFLKDNIFRFNGFDNILIGQGEIPNHIDKAFLEKQKIFLPKKVDLWEKMTRSALFQKEALAIVSTHPEILQNIMDNE